MKKIAPHHLIIIISVVFNLFYNLSFYHNVIEVYPLSTFQNVLFVSSLFVVFTCVTIVILSLLCYQYTIKPTLILLLLLSSACAYFMDTYHVIIDDVMIDNIVKTDTAEAFDLLSMKQGLYILLLGIVPALWVFRLNIIKQTIKQAVFTKVILIVTSLAIIASCVLTQGDYYSSFLRENKSLRNYSNPTYYIYSIGKYVANLVKSDEKHFVEIGTDAHIYPVVPDRELIIVVVGETARADHFSLNGYSKKTNPRLEQEDIINFPNMWSCGTSTAVSVPCMFAHASKDHYKSGKAKSTSNVLDIAQKSGVNVLWLDNNSSSKGVADRVEYHNYKSPDTNPVCDIECRDIGMLSNLQSYIDAHPDGDILIVLHQMGNHGPAYYKRYPKEFERFTPTCKTNQLDQCSDEEINNAYDNAILYTDHFLAETINLLKDNDNNFETAMLYVSDHGESLGENGLYLHGLPYLLAPDNQKHVPMVMWFGQHFDMETDDIAALKQRANNKYSHDNVFHTLLSFVEVQTDVYEPSLDILHNED